MPVAAVPDALPLGSHAGYPSFLSVPSGEPGVILGSASVDAVPLRRLDRFTTAHRAALADALLRELRKWDAPGEALASAEMLRGENCYAVVTGQQAGIAGGPLYTLYKAVGAVRAAAELARLHPAHRFVPVFWIEADDHDFDEARRVALLDRSGNVHALAYDDGDARPLHVGDRRNSAEGAAALIAALRDVLPSSEFTDDALQLVADAYRTGDAETLADGFARSLYAMLGATPLVLVNSRNPELKRLAADVFEREVAAPERMFPAIEARTVELAALGLPTPIVPKPGCLFITYEGERRSLVPDGESYQIRGTDERISREEAVRTAREHPERLSPNVMLRPIVQDAILPTVVYLGGPSEVAYLRQIGPAYESFGMEPPAIAPRPFVLIVEPKVRRVLEGESVTLEMLVAEKFDAAALVVDRAIVDELEEAKGRALAKLREAFGEMEEITRRIDPTLEKTLGSAGAGAGKGVEDLAKKLAAALKRRQQTEIDRLNGARALLLPNGAPQERGVNALHFIARYGLERFREMLGGITAATGVVQVMEI